MRRRGIYPAGPAARRGAAPEGHDRPHPSSRPGRRRLLRPKQLPTAATRSVSAIAASPSSTSPRATSRSRISRPASRWYSTAKSTISWNCAASSRARAIASAPRSDTEVLLTAYVEWGPRCVERFRGMFAFALWDDKRQRLMLARDHFGKKPLFLQESGGKRAVRLRDQGDPGVRRYRTGAGPRLARRLFRLSLRAGAAHAVRRHPQAHARLLRGLGERPADRDRVLSTALRRDAGRRRRSTDPLAAFSDKLDEAVRIRMVSDVPFGAFLSGGLDSSAIVALMSRHSAQPINTFSVGFREARYSELPYAAMIARAVRDQPHRADHRRRRSDATFADADRPSGRAGRRSVEHPDLSHFARSGEEREDGADRRGFR